MDRSLVFDDEIEAVETGTGERHVTLSYRNTGKMADGFGRGNGDGRSRSASSVMQSSSGVVTRNTDL